MQCQLDESRTADGVLDGSAAARGRDQITWRGAAVERSRHIRRITERRIEGDVVIRRVEARMIEGVEELPIEANRQTLVQARFLEHREIEAGLEAPTKDSSS